MVANILRAVLVAALFLVWLPAPTPAGEWRPASTIPYQQRVTQTTIRAVAKELLLEYRMQQVLLERSMADLRRLEENRYARQRLTGSLEMEYDALQGKWAAFYEISDEVAKCLESVIQRSNAGESFDPDSAELFLRETYIRLIQLKLVVRSHRWEMGTFIRRFK
jgi:hypothetical protein